MRLSNYRISHLEEHYQRDAFVAAVHQVLSGISGRIEGFGLYLLICMFWGLLLYAAVLYALP